VTVPENAPISELPLVSDIVLEPQDSQSLVIKPVPEAQWVFESQPVSLFARRSVRILALVLLALTAFRFWLSSQLGLWFNTGAMLDDHLLIEYADFRQHFIQTGWHSLVKTLGFPIFLRFVSITELPFPVVLTAVWVIVALLITLAFRQLTSNVWWLGFTYLFVLFTPSAFDFLVGTRLYRNSVFAPFIYLVFALMLLLIVYTLKARSTKSLVLIASSLAVAFTFTYYLNEAGYWLVPCLVLCLLVCLGVQVFRWCSTSGRLPLKRYLGNVAIFVIPIAGFAFGSVIYHSINYVFFGVWAIETRQSAELGRFVHNVYRIQSDNRDAVFWAPRDAIEAAFAASPTLQIFPPEVLAGIGQPNGDFLTWELRQSLGNAGFWLDGRFSERQVNDTFAIVNAELDEAFATGTLLEDDRFQLVSSAGGRTPAEIERLIPNVFDAMRSVVFSEVYVPGGIPAEGDNPGALQRASFLANFPIRFETQHDSMAQRDLNLANAIAAVVFRIYGVINPILAVGALIGAVYGLVTAIRRRRDALFTSRATDLTLALTTFALIGISMLYIFGISWFAEFIWITTTLGRLSMLLYYGVGLVPLLSLAMISGAFLLFSAIERSKFGQRFSREVDGAA